MRRRLRRAFRRMVWRVSGRCLSCYPVFEPPLHVQFHYGRACRVCG